MPTAMTTAVVLCCVVLFYIRVIHARLHEESVECNKAWMAFAKSTFECGRRDLIALREEWVRDTTRAWSGQVRHSNIFFLSSRVRV